MKANAGPSAPKEILIANISRMNPEYFKAMLVTRG
jgi:hypothetical protein